MGNKKKVDKTGNCRLCLQSKDLCESHIIPKSFFDRSGLFEISDAHPFKKNLREGWKELLLCRDCEEQLGQFEDYTAKFFNNMENWEEIVIQGLKVYKIQQYDYRKLKLFFMSVLWRAGITTLDAFEKVSLGPFEEDLRQRIYQQDAGSYQDYSIAMAKFSPHPLDFHKIIFTPHRFKQKGVNYYQVQLNEFYCRIKVCSRKHLEVYRLLTISETPPLHIFETRFEDIPRLEVMHQMVHEQPKKLARFKAGHQKKSDQVTKQPNEEKSQ